MSVFTKEIMIESRDVSMSAKLRPSAFLQLFQEIAGDHSTAMGYGYEMTHTNHVMWIIVKNHVIFHELPSYTDRVVLSTWVTDRRHLMFPRYCRMETLDGRPLVDAASYYVLVDYYTRQSVFPEHLDIPHSDAPTGREIALPGRIHLPELTHSAPFTIPYSYIDLNRHMNNVKYVDLAEDELGLAQAGHELKELTIEYVNEAKLGETLTLSWANRDDNWYLAGNTDQRIFNLQLKYD